MDETTFEGWGSVAVAARVIGCTPAWARILADRGTLRSRRTPLGRLVDLRDAKRFRQEREREGVGARGRSRRMIG